MQMVYEIFEDLQDDTGRINFDGWRCVMCGEIVIPSSCQSATTARPDGGAQSKNHGPPVTYSVSFRSSNHAAR
jgi:hypothetical protein